MPTLHLHDPPQDHVLVARYVAGRSLVLRFSFAVLVQQVRILMDLLQEIVQPQKARRAGQEKAQEISTILILKLRSYSTMGRQKRA